MQSKLRLFEGRASQSIRNYNTVYGAIQRYVVLRVNAPGGGGGLCNFDDVVAAPPGRVMEEGLYLFDDTAALPPWAFRRGFFVLLCFFDDVAAAPPGGRHVCCYAFLTM